MAGPQRAHGGPALELLHAHVAGGITHGREPRDEVSDARYLTTRRRGRTKLVQEKTKTSFVCEETPNSGNHAGLHGAV